ncbi:MAG: DUF1573 domain-containing protein [Candidatus Ratteibacteria bacterium]
MYKYLLIISICLSYFSAECAPKLAWEEIRTMQEVEKGQGRIKHTLIFRNEGDSTLKISRIRKSCGSCASLNFTQKEIPPGSEEKLKVEVILPRGATSKKISIYVESNDPENPVLQISVNSELLGLNYPYLINFGNVAENTSEIKTVEIFSTGKKSFQIKDISWGPSVESIKTKTIDEGKKYKLEILLKPHRFAKPIRDSIKVRTNYPGLEEINISLLANITAPITIYPEEILIPNSTDIHVTRYIFLEAVSNIPLEIETIKIPTSSMEFEILPLSNNSYRIRLSNIKVSDVLKNEAIRIYISMPDKKEIVIPFKLIE